MRAAAQEFATKAGEFKNDNNTVATQVGVLLASWTGRAAQGFGSAMEQWRQSFNEVISALEGMEEQMKQTSAGYTAGEDEVTSTTSKLASGLPSFK
jgi:WXG100 family type VII secretion target